VESRPTDIDREVLWPNGDGTMRVTTLRKEREREQREKEVEEGKRQDPRRGRGWYTY